MGKYVIDPESLRDLLRFLEFDVFVVELSSASGVPTKKIYRKPFVDSMEAIKRDCIGIKETSTRLLAFDVKKSAYSTFYTSQIISLEIGDLKLTRKQLIEYSNKRSKE